MKRSYLVAIPVLLTFAVLVQIRERSEAEAISVQARSDIPVAANKAERAVFVAAAPLSASSDPERVEEVRAPDSYLRYRELTSKVLLREEEKAALKKSLSRREALQFAELKLIDLRSNEYSAVAEEERMDALEFFAEAFKLPENPLRRELEETAEKILSYRRTTAGMSYALKKSLVGDQVELFRLLLHFAPESAERVLEDSRGTANEKIYRYALNNHESN